MVMVFPFKQIKPNLKRSLSEKKKQKTFDLNNFRQINCERKKTLGSGGGSVGRAVASDARDPGFESSHQQTFISKIYLFTDKK